MKSLPEKYLDEFKKKKLLNLFRLSTYDCIGIEQIYYQKSDLYQVIVASETARLYRLSLDNLKLLFEMNKKSFCCFDKYAKKKMQNFIKRLISCKDLIIQIIDSSEDYPQEPKLSNTGVNNANMSSGHSNNYLNKIQNSFFKINQSFVFKNELGLAGNFNLGNSNDFDTKKSGTRARSNLFENPQIMENNMLYENIPKSKLIDNNCKENFNNYKNLKDKKKKIDSRKSASKAKIQGQIKKYKIIEKGEDLNILYKNHKSPKEFSKLNDKLFTMLNSNTKYKIPNIEKIIEEEVEKMNKPLSELKREQLNLKRMLKCETVDLNTKDKSLNVISNDNLNRKFHTSANLNYNNIINISRKDFNNSRSCKKIISGNNIRKKMIGLSALNDECRIDYEKYFSIRLTAINLKTLIRLVNLIII